MVPFCVFATMHLRSLSSPPRLCVFGELCVKIPMLSLSNCHAPREIPVKTHQKTLFKSVPCALFHFPYPASRLFAIHTKTAGCIPTIPIMELAAHNPPLTTAFPSFVFILLRTLLHLFALLKNSTLLFSIDSALFGKNTRGWGGVVC